MKAEERAFLRALAAWHGGSDYAAPNPAAARAAQALNKAIADQPPYWERCACRGSGPSCGVPTCERHQRGALSVSGEAPPKKGAHIELTEYEAANLWAALVAINGNPKYDPGVVASPLGALNTGDWVNQIRWKIEAEAPGGRPNKTPAEMCADAISRAAPVSAPPPEKEPRPDMTTLRGANLGDTTGAAPPKEPCTHWFGDAMRCEWCGIPHAAAPPKEPPVPETPHSATGAARSPSGEPTMGPGPETRSVEEILTDVVEHRQTAHYADAVRKALRLYREENALWDREALRASDMILGLRAERDEARNERDARRDRKVLCADLEARIDAALALVPQGTVMLGTEHCKQLRAALRGGKVERD